MFLTPIKQHLQFNEETTNYDIVRRYSKPTTERKETYIREQVENDIKGRLLRRFRNVWRQTRPQDWVEYVHDQVAYFSDAFDHTRAIEKNLDIPIPAFYHECLNGLPVPENPFAPLGPINPLLLPPSQRTNSQI